MSCRCSRAVVVALWFVLVGMGTAWAQEQPQLALTGRVTAGVADFSEDGHGVSGPGATLESNLTGYWRDPRIF